MHVAYWYSYETSLLLHGDVTIAGMGCKFWPMLGTNGNWTVRVLQRATPSVTRGIRLQWSSLRTRDTLTYCRAFGCGAVMVCFYDLSVLRLGFEHPIFCMRGERSKSLRHRRVWTNIMLKCDLFTWTYNNYVYINIIKPHVNIIIM